eukprot:scaffold12505_cov17-Prasinocladus_malaysianus.AAC.1
MLRKWHCIENTMIIRVGQWRPEAKTKTAFSIQKCNTRAYTCVGVSSSRVKPYTMHSLAVKALKILMNTAQI